MLTSRSFVGVHLYQAIAITLKKSTEYILFIAFAKERKTPSLRVNGPIGSKQTNKCANIYTYYTENKAQDKFSYYYMVTA